MFKSHFPYTDDEWYLRSETPRDPSFLAFGLPEVWVGFEDEAGDIWGKPEV